MRNKIRLVGAFVPLSLLLTLLWVYAPADGQSPPGVSNSVRQAASAILNSSSAQFVSSSGLTALDIISGRLPVTRLASGGSAPLLNIPSYVNQRLVNDPSKDVFSFLDVSTQSESSGAGYQNIVLVAYNDSSDFVLSGSFTGYSRSTDEGQSFRDMGAVPPSSTGELLGDPAAASDRFGRFFIGSLAFESTQPRGFEQTIAISRSTDGGLTFTPPVYVPQASVAPLGMADKDQLTVDNARGRFDGNIYVTYTAFQAPGSPVLGAPIAFSRSTDSGLTFSQPILISLPGEFNQGAEPAVAPDGTIYVAWYRFVPGPQAMMVAKSTDGGLTFSRPVVAATVTPIGFGAGVFGGNLTGNFRVNMFPRIDVTRDGAVLLVYNSNPPAPEDGSDVYLVRSADRGLTWSEPLQLNDDRTSADQFFPDVAVNDRGARVIWYDTRQRPNSAYILIDVYSAVSIDGGRTFGSNERITNSSFPPAVGYDPVTNPVYMGDYIDIKAAIGTLGPMNRLLLDWGDNRREVVTQGGIRHDQDVVFTAR